MVTSLEYPPVTLWRYTGQLPHLLSLLKVEKGKEFYFLKALEKYFKGDLIPSDIFSWEASDVSPLATGFIYQMGPAMWGEEEEGQPGHQDNFHDEMCLFFWYFITLGVDPYTEYVFGDAQHLVVSLSEKHHMDYTDMLKALKMISAHLSTVRIKRKAGEMHISAKNDGSPSDDEDKEDGDPEDDDEDGDSSTTPGCTCSRRNQGRQRG